MDPASCAPSWSYWPPGTMRRGDTDDADNAPGTGPGANNEGDVSTVTIIRRLGTLAAGVLMTGGVLLAVAGPSAATEASSPAPSTSASASPPGPVAKSPTPKPAQDCAAYLYAGSTVNLCGQFPAGKDVDCKAIGYKIQLAGKADPWRLDADQDGVGCETYPIKRFAAPKTSEPPAGGGGELPVTGTPIGAVAAIGVGIVGLGVAGLFVARHRRRFSAE